MARTLSAAEPASYLRLTATKSLIVGGLVTGRVRDEVIATGQNATKDCNGAVSFDASYQSTD